MSQMTTQTLTTTFHCDRCGAMAKVRVVLPSGSDLVFCGHHAREYEDKLRDLAADIIETDGEARVSS
jgi:transcription elongation factor Elf1